MREDAVDDLDDVEIYISLRPGFTRDLRQSWLSSLPSTILQVSSNYASFMVIASEMCIHSESIILLYYRS